MRKESFSELVEHIKACGFECDFFGPGQIGGYRCEQDPEELADLIMLLREITKEKGLHNYAEIGSASGGTMRHIYEQVGFNKALSIDHGQWQAEHFPKNTEAFKDRIERHILDSHSEEALSRFTKFYDANKPTILFIDGDHSFEGVMEDISFYATQIQTGDTLIFHDVFCDKVPGVAQAVLNLMCNLDHLIKAKPKQINLIRNEYAKNKLGILCLEF